MTERPVHATVGASLTGAKAAEELRAAGFAGRILLIGQEPERPYERPPLSKGYLLGADPREKAYVHGPGWYDQHGVELLLGVRATGLDPAGHTLTLDGPDPVRYDKLLLATGSRVRRLDVPGTDLPGVRYLRALPDADALLFDLPRAGAGGGGRRRVDRPGDRCRRTPPRRGGDGVQEFRAGDGGRVAGVLLTDGTELPADLAIVGVGITPATELAQAAGLTVDNGVAVDAGLRTSDPDIYAAGDVAAFVHPLLGKRIRVEHWSNALNGGRAAARAMLGEPVSYDRVPYFFTARSPRLILTRALRSRARVCIRILPSMFLPLPLLPRPQ
jgi:3-phenylpropionate/trans-cinnamate dioxygenase ferredoxin reductase subunit